MKIGVVSDTHDRLETTATAIRLLRERGVEVILHCGDIVRPAMVKLFEAVPTHFVFGNWDDAAELIPFIEKLGATAHPDFGHLSLDGKEIAWVHSHRYNQMRKLEQGGEYDFLFYGHSHVAESHRTGKTLVANPGALYRARMKTCLVVDLDNGQLQSLEVESL